MSVTEVPWHLWGPLAPLVSPRSLGLMEVPRCCQGPWASVGSLGVTEVPWHHILGIPCVSPWSPGIPGVPCHHLSPRALPVSLSITVTPPGSLSVSGVPRCHQEPWTSSGSPWYHFGPWKLPGSPGTSGVPWCHWGLLSPLGSPSITGVPQHLPRHLPGPHTSPVSPGVCPCSHDATVLSPQAQQCSGAPSR